jgi:alkylation response protein AidB-like acyl-CoA dehydrogenase
VTITAEPLRTTLPHQHRPARPSLAAAAELGAAADERSAELEAARRVPEDLWHAAARAGLFRQLVGQPFAGAMSSPLDWFRTGVELARHEASFGWAVTQGAVELGWIATGADPDWAEQVLADPLSTSASSVAGVGSLQVHGDRSRFAGRWAFNTGCQNATWIGGLAVVDGRDGDGMPEMRWGWVPAERAHIVEDWDPIGLAGTGSHTTVVPEQDIPTSWTFDPMSPTRNDRGPYRALVGNGNWPVATAVAATQLGNARRALDEAWAVVLEKAPMPDFVPLARNAAVQHALVEAEGRWLAAAGAVEHELEALWSEATAAGTLSTDVRVRLHAANVTANRLATRAVESVCETTGTTAVARRHVLGRCLRDAHALRGHIATGGTSIEQNAKVRLGLTSGHILV